MAPISSASLRPPPAFAILAGPLLVLACCWRAAEGEYVGSECLEVDAQAEGDATCALQTRVKKEVVDVEAASGWSQDDAAEAAQWAMATLVEKYLAPNLTDNLTADIEFLMDLRRPDMAGGLKARSLVVARMQSVLEEAHYNRTGSHGAPIELHEAVLMIDDALKMIKDSKHAKIEGPHETDLGYPMTAIEALAFYTNITQMLGIPLSQHTCMGQYFLEFAHLLVREGLASRKARDYYGNVLLYADKFSAPVDLGWLNSFVGIASTYAFGKGWHAYRKVPETMRGSYDPTFSVRALPKQGLNGGPLVIGLISDWAGGTLAAAAVLRELKKLNPDVVIHLGDTYYSGTKKEQRDFLLLPMLSAFGVGPGKPLVLLLPGNHDYYSDGGKPFFEMIDLLDQQDASYFCLRGEHFQILGLDTALIDNAQALFKGPIGPSLMPFLTSDQATWAQEQLRIGKEKGLKTVMLSHHQFFTNREELGHANGMLAEMSFLPDLFWGTFPFLKDFSIKSEDLPGALPADKMGPVNTRLQYQFPPESLEHVSAWFWGHDHQTAIYKPYAGLERGRLIGNGVVPLPKDQPRNIPNHELVSEPWGGLPEMQEGTDVSSGDRFWAFGFATLTIDGPNAKARYFQLVDSTGADGLPEWGHATQFYEEEF